MLDTIPAELPLLRLKGIFDSQLSDWKPEGTRDGSKPPLVTLSCRDSGSEFTTGLLQESGRTPRWP